MNKSLLNKSNIEVTNVIIPENEKLENVALFLKLMNLKLTNIDSVDFKTVIKTLNERQIQILGTRNKSYALAKELGWSMNRVNVSGHLGQQKVNNNKQL